MVHDTTKNILYRPALRKFETKEKDKIIEILANNLLKVVDSIGNKDLSTEITMTGDFTNIMI